VLIAITSGGKVGLALMGGLFVTFALVSSMVIPRYRPDFPGSHLKLFLAVCGVITVGMFTSVIVFATESETSHAGTETAPAVQPPPPAATTTAGGTPTTPAAAGDPVAGKKVFETAGCVACHTLSDAGATGTVGPNLDQAKPPHDLVVQRVTNGKGAMPPFKGQLSEKQIQDVAAYVVSATQG
jgi:mono/diheme cytochrome c family protein